MKPKRKIAASAAGHIALRVARTGALARCVALCDKLEALNAIAGDDTDASVVCVMITRELRLALTGGAA